jgi:hypothetical protein
MYTFQVRHSTFPIALPLILCWLTEDPAFLALCSSHFIDALVEPNTFLGPTSLVIVAALATEFSASLSMRAPEILSGLAARLKACPRKYTQSTKSIHCEIAFIVDDLPPRICPGALHYSYAST